MRRESRLPRSPRHARRRRLYVDIRKQWKRLLAIAAGMLGYELMGKKVKFLNFRHTGASRIAGASHATLLPS